VAWNLFGGFFEHRDGGHDLARSAIAALETVALDEGGLHGMEFVAVGQPLDGCDFVVLVRDGKRKAGEHALPVNVNGTCAALALIAAFLASAERELFPQGVKQGGSGVELEISLFAVDT
jgi:hypothetical protein